MSGRSLSLVAQQSEIGHWPTSFITSDRRSALLNQSRNFLAKGRAAGVRWRGRHRGRKPARLCSMNRSAIDAAGCVVADGFAGEASAANHEFTLEPRLVGLIGRLLLFPAVFWSTLAIRFGRDSVEWAQDDFTFRARMLLGSKLKRLGVVRRGGAKPVPRDRTSGRRYTTVS